MNAFEQLERERRLNDEMARLLGECGRFIPYEKPKQGPLPDWIVELAAARKAALARHRELRHLPLGSLRKAKN